MRADLTQALMEEFADSTGVSGKAKPRRYLWTDAFAVCNFLGLARQTGNDRYLQFARQLVDQVHHVLGRHRDDDPRQGWISGLPDEEGERHPTRGGLRIGKPQNERGPDQPADSQLEWHQDGQYFHYLTKWMHALFRMGQETDEPHFRQWAAELAATAFNAFSYRIASGSPKRLVWKMSIDLSRPLISSMGQHDPLDGLITCLELQTAPGFDQADGTDLTPAIVNLTQMCAQGRWATEDPLGIGGLLDAATRLDRVDIRAQELCVTNCCINSWSTPSVASNCWTGQFYSAVPPSIAWHFASLALRSAFTGCLRSAGWCSETKRW